MEDEEAISLYVYLRLEMPVIKSEIEAKTDFTYEEYCDKILEDVQFKKAVFIAFAHNNMPIFIEELIDLIKSNKVPIHISSEQEAMG